MSVDERNCTIAIRDNGIGIPLKYHDKIFEQYFRVPTGNIHSVKGFGVGLAYVRLIILQHKGEIKVNSELEKGSTFTIKLPIIHE